MKYAEMFRKFLEIELGINRWVKIPLKLWFKINVIKTNILPHLMYVLSGIPMLISNRYFLQIDKLFRKFIWDIKVFLS